MIKTIDETYLSLCHKILTQGKVKENRTGVDTISISGHMLEHDMSHGFPILSTKKIAWKTLRVELEGFIKGITDKKWYQDRGCHIWDEWCNPQKVPYGHDEETKAKMKAERDLGPIYGYQWRRFNMPYTFVEGDPGYNPEMYLLETTDQLAWAVHNLIKNPQNRRIIVNAWNPNMIGSMALPPCHYSYQLLCNEGTLDLIWSQRSCDTFLGIPFNITSYGLLLELLAKESGLKAGKLIGMLGDVHIYENHREQIVQQMEREPFAGCKLTLPNDDEFSLWDWTWDQANLEGYRCHGAIKAEVAV